MHITKTTKKGQITIPAEYRKKLKSDYYTVEIKDEEIIIKPVKKLAGSLKKYAKKGENIEEVLEKEQKALERVFIENQG